MYLVGFLFCFFDNREWFLYLQLVMCDTRLVDADVFDTSRWFVYFSRGVFDTRLSFVYLVSFL